MNTYIFVIHTFLNNCAWTYKKDSIKYYSFKNKALLQKYNFSKSTITLLILYNFMLRKSWNIWIQLENVHIDGFCERNHLLLICVLLIKWHKLSIITCISFEKGSQWLQPSVSIIFVTFAVFGAIFLFQSPKLLLEHPLLLSLITATPFFITLLLRIF